MLLLQESHRNSCTHSLRDAAALASLVMHSKEPYTHSNEPYVHSKESYTHSKEPCAHSKEPYTHSKEPYTHSKEPCKHSKEPDTHATEPSLALASLVSIVLLDPAAKTDMHSQEPYTHFKEPCIPSKEHYVRSREAYIEADVQVVASAQRGSEHDDAADCNQVPAAATSTHAMSLGLLRPPRPLMRYPSPDQVPVNGPSYGFVWGHDPCPGEVQDEVATDSPDVTVTELRGALQTVNLGTLQHTATHCDTHDEGGGGGGEHKSGHVVGKGVATTRVLARWQQEGSDKDTCNEEDQENDTGSCEALLAMQAHQRRYCNTLLHCITL